MWISFQSPTPGCEEHKALAPFTSPDQIASTCTAATLPGWSARSASNTLR